MLSCCTVIFRDPADGISSAKCGYFSAITFLRDLSQICTSKSTFGHLKKKTKTLLIVWIVNKIVLCLPYLMNASINSSRLFFDVAARYAGVKPFRFNWLGFTVLLSNSNSEHSSCPAFVARCSAEFPSLSSKFTSVGPCSSSARSASSHPFAAAKCTGAFFRFLLMTFTSTPIDNSTRTNSDRPADAQHMSNKVPW